MYWDPKGRFRQTWLVPKGRKKKNAIFLSAESNTCARQCCGAARGFTMHITDNFGQVKTLLIVPTQWKQRHSLCSSFAKETFVFGYKVLTCSTSTPADGSGNLVAFMCCRSTNLLNVEIINRRCYALLDRWRFVPVVTAALGVPVLPWRLMWKLQWERKLAPSDKRKLISVLTIYLIFWETGLWTDSGCWKKMVSFVKCAFISLQMQFLCSEIRCPGRRRQRGVMHRGSDVYLPRGFMYLGSGIQCESKNAKSRELARKAEVLRCHNRRATSHWLVTPLVTCHPPHWLVTPYWHVTSPCDLPPPAWMSPPPSPGVTSHKGVTFPWGVTSWLFKGGGVSALKGLIKPEPGLLQYYFAPYSKAAKWWKLFNYSRCTHSLSR